MYSKVHNTQCLARLSVGQVCFGGKWAGHAVRSNCGTVMCCCPTKSLQLWATFIFNLS